MSEFATRRSLARRVENHRFNSQQDSSYSRFVAVLFTVVLLFCFRGTDLMMHPDLQIDVEFLGPLLSPKVEQELLDT